MVGMPDYNFMGSEENTKVKLSDEEIEALDQKLGNPAQDAARVKLLLAIGKVSKENYAWSAERPNSRMPRSASTPLKDHPNCNQGPLAMKSRLMEEAMKNSVDSGPQSYRTPAKNMQATT